MDRLFLDANVPFSAAYRSDAGLRRLWDLVDVTLVTSAYALEEARVNLQEEAQRTRLARLARSMQIVAGSMHRSLPLEVTLRDKDRPILLAAIAAGATHLLTGDRRDFGAYYGQVIAGVLIVPPAAYLRSRP